MMTRCSHCSTLENAAIPYVRCQKDLKNIAHEKGMRRERSNAWERQRDDVLYVYLRRLKTNCGGPIELDTFQGVVRGTPRLAEFESATKRSQTLPGSDSPKRSESA